MSIYTPIQWSDGAVNPVMGCDGCEMWPTISTLAAAIMDALSSADSVESSVERWEIKEFIEDLRPSDVYHARQIIASTIARWFVFEVKKDRRYLEECIARAIAAPFKCYAGFLHLRHGADDAKPEKRINPGYAKKFEEVTLFPGRMLEAVNWADLRGQTRPDKPWLDGLPRLIFVSDMGDALSAAVPFEYLKREIIESVNSVEGNRHVWLWLTKQPRRMAQFSDWLLAKGIPWPDHLVAMTSVTSQKTAPRVAQLGKVKSHLRGLSVEPLWEKVTLDLDGIDWLIVGGESANPRRNAEPFDLDWARDLHEQCRRANVAFFVKQLGSRPVADGEELKLVHNHGGDWNEWPADLRIRDLPTGFREVHGDSIVDSHPSR